MSTHNKKRGGRQSWLKEEHERNKEEDWREGHKSAPRTKSVEYLGFNFSHSILVLLLYSLVENMYLMAGTSSFVFLLQVMSWI